MCHIKDFRTIPQFPSWRFKKKTHTKAVDGVVWHRFSKRGQTLERYMNSVWCFFRAKRDGRSKSFLGQPIGERFSPDREAVPQGGAAPTLKSLGLSRTLSRIDWHGVFMVDWNRAKTISADCCRKARAAGTKLHYEQPKIGCEVTLANEHRHESRAVDSG